MNISKIFGSALIVLGTMIGAGMLALPIVSSGISFYISVIMLIAMWMVMLITADMVLEVNLAFPEYHNSFSTMAAKTLGSGGKVISWLCTLLLLYALTAGYISGNASLLSSVVDTIFDFHLPKWVSALGFLTVMGGMVFWSTKSVDFCNRFFISFKGILLALAIFLLMPRIDFVNLARESNSVKTILHMMPIFLCSFGFHPTIPSLTNYIGRKPKELKFAIIIGSGAALTIYLLWLVVTMGVVSFGGEQSFASIQQVDGQILVNDFTRLICKVASNKWVTLGINGFSNITMTTSFLGVSLGLFDFLADGFNRPNSHFGRFQTSLLTFIPPLVFALFFPNGFILALKYAAFFATILVIILPVLMVYKLRKSNELSSPYRVFGGKYLLGVIMLVGVAMLCVEVFVLFSQFFVCR